MITGLGFVRLLGIARFGLVLVSSQNDRKPRRCIVNTETLHHAARH